MTPCQSLLSRNTRSVSFLPFFPFVSSFSQFLINACLHSSINTTPSLSSQLQLLFLQVKEFKFPDIPDPVHLFLLPTLLKKEEKKRAPKEMENPTFATHPVYLSADCERASSHKNKKKKKER